MNTGNAVDLYLQRIKAASGKEDVYRVASHVELLKEYLRRRVLWGKALNCCLDIRDWPFVNLAAQIGPSIPLDTRHLQTLLAHIKTTENGRYLAMKALLQMALYWAGVKEISFVEAYDLPDPFEPIIIFYERGGVITGVPEGFYEMVDGRITLIANGPKYFDRAEPFVELDTALLDKIDEDYNREHPYPPLILE